MKNLIEKWLELKKIKYEKLFCKHEWEKRESWDTTNKYTQVKHEGAITLFFCKKCGEMKKIAL